MLGIAASSKRPQVTAFTLIAVWFFIVPGVSRAQVVIEERVEIEAYRAHSRVDTTGKTSTIVPFIVTPWDGWLKVLYFEASHFNFPIPPSTQLSVVVGESVVASEEFLDSRLVLSDTTALHTCYGVTDSLFNYSDTPDSLWTANRVAGGDTVQLQAFGSPEYIQYSDSVWTVSMSSRCFPEISRFSQLLNVGVFVVRDTLDILFSPAEDGTIFPEPDLIVEVDAVVRGAGNLGEVLFEISNHDYPFPEGPDSLIYFLDGTDTTLTLDPVSVVGDTASVTLIATQYWGAVDVTAKYVLNTDTINVKMERWPEDNDRDGIADRWETDVAWKAMGDTLNACKTPSVVCQDGEWDAEKSSFTTIWLGDKISKLREYQGALVGSVHHRLNPKRREVFIDYDDNPHGSWAVDQAINQLDIDVFSVDGLVMNQNDTLVTLVSGSTPLRWPGGLPSGQTHHFILIDSVLYGTPDSLDSDMTSQGRVNHKHHGITIVNGVYEWDPVSVNSQQCQVNKFCQPHQAKGNQEYGSTDADIKNGTRFWISRTYLGSIANIWGNANSIPANAGAVYRGHQFTAKTSGFDKVVDYQTAFPDTSISGMVNPFEGLSYPSSGSNDNDNFYNGKVMGLTQLEFAQRNTLHELGHALGIWEKGHPSALGSVMRRGISPYKTATFELQDKRTLQFK